MKLKRSSDRKTAHSVTASGNVRGKNAFALPAGNMYSCPGATSICEKVCYANKLERIYKGFRDVVLHNWELLKDANLETMQTLIHAMISEFVEETDRIIARGNKATYDFRIHIDGDFFSRDYAKAWANVMRDFPNVSFWAYTRTFDVVDILAGIDNLSLYLSADADNIVKANAIAAEFPSVNIATLADTFDEARDTIIDNTRKAYRCPENGGRMPLISPKGSACIACGVCPIGRGDVLFSITKK